MRHGDAGHQPLDSLNLGSSELRVLEIDVVNDLGDGTQGSIFGLELLDEDLERAAVPVVGVLRLEHVEPQFSRLGPVASAGDELEARLGVDESPDEPGAGHAVDVNALAGHPRAAARPPADHPGCGWSALFALRGPQPRFDIAQELVDGATAGCAEEIDR